MPSPSTKTRTLEELVGLLLDLGWIDSRRRLGGLERLVGWENAVVRTEDGWIYRFSRLDADRFEREVEILAAVEVRSEFRHLESNWSTAPTG